MRKLIVLFLLALPIQAQQPTSEDRTLKALGSLYLQCTEVNGNLQKEIQRLTKENAELKKAKEGSDEKTPAPPAPADRSDGK